MYGWCFREDGVFKSDFKFIEKYLKWVMWGGWKILYLKIDFRVGPQGLWG